MKIKGFDKDLKCRGFQFKVGEIYDTGAKDDELKLCSDKVFHYCDSLSNVHSYYSVKPESNNRFCEIEVLGEEVSDGEKCGSNKIKIVREIIGKELDCLRGCMGNNTGVFNTGDWNTGDYNTGYRNTGDRNTGNYNTGDWNTGAFNSCNFSSGFFCVEEPKATVFDIETNMTVSEFYNSEYYDLLIRHQLELTKWVEYTKEEKKADNDKKLIGGYLKQFTFKEACANWWALYDESERKEFLKIPNFDKNKFKAITGIEIQD